MAIGSSHDRLRRLFDLPFIEARAVIVHHGFLLDVFWKTKNPYAGLASADFSRFERSSDNRISGRVSPAHFGLIPFLHLLEVTWE